MHQALAELAGFFSLPSNGIAALAVLALVMLLLHRRSGAAIAAVALVALAVGALSPLGNMLLTPLEQRFPETGFPNERLDGVTCHARWERSEGPDSTSSHFPLVRGHAVGLNFGSWRLRRPIICDGSISPRTSGSVCSIIAFRAIPMSGSRGLRPRSLLPEGAVVGGSERWYWREA
jgi:hypothetical protein